ncbi:MAG: glycosyltransferase [Armatimonadetes bacterium]|nr:glycosyltransferase [Armatimonadota bacterium]
MRTLVPALSDLGHACYLVSSGGSSYHQVRPVFRDVAAHPPLPVLASIAVSRALERWSIDIVVTQTLNSAVHALGACRRARIPLIMNIHSLRDMRPGLEALAYASRIIGMNRGTVEHIRREVPEYADKVYQSILPVDCKHFSPEPRESTADFTVVHCCRLSRTKGAQVFATIAAVEALVPEMPDLALVVVGGVANRLRMVRDAAERVNITQGKMVITAPGQVDDPRPYLHQADVVIGAGYVALEALAMNRRLIGVGFEGVWGHVDEAEFMDALAGNFGDTAARLGEANPEIMAEMIRDAHTRHREQGQITWGSGLVCAMCDPQKVAADLVRVYEDALAGR